MNHNIMDILKNRVSGIRRELDRELVLSVIEGCEEGNLNAVRSAIEKYENSATTKTDKRITHQEAAMSDDGDDMVPDCLIDTAVLSFNPKILCLILEKGFYRIKQDNSVTPIHMLVKSIIDFRIKEGMHNMKDMLKLLCDVGYDVNKENNSGLTPLHCACKAGDEYLEISKLLIEAGADVNYMNDEEDEGLTPLHYVCKANGENLKLAKTLIEAGADVNIEDNSWLTPLHYVCEAPREKLQLAKILIEAGADVNYMNDEGDEGLTPLHYVCKANGENLKLAKTLIEAGADVNIEDNSVLTPLHYVCEAPREKLQLAKILIEAGADVNYMNNQGFEGMRPLHYVCKAGENLELAKTLIEKGAGVNEVDKSGQTPLHHIDRADRENLELAKTLIEAGASVNKVDNSKQTPLHYVCEAPWENTELAKLLIEAGADVNYKNGREYDGRTPLHHVCADNPEKLELAKTLIAAGADVNELDNTCNTPLYYVCTAHEEYLELAKALVEAGADVNFRNMQGPYTALHSSVGYGKPHLSMYFLNKGVDWAIDPEMLFEDLIDQLESEDSSPCEYVTILKTLIAYGFDVNRHACEDQVSYLMSKDAKTKPETSREIYELFRQSGLRFTDSQQQASSWISCTQNPLSLQRLCANKVRGCFGSKLNQNLKILDMEFLPQTVKDFIMLKD